MPELCIRNLYEMIDYNETIDYNKLAAFHFRLTERKVFFSIGGRSSINIKNDASGDFEAFMDTCCRILNSVTFETDDDCKAAVLKFIQCNSKYIYIPDDITAELFKKLTKCFILYNDTIYVNLIILRKSDLLAYFPESCVDSNDNLKNIEKQYCTIRFISDCKDVRINVAKTFLDLYPPEVKPEKLEILDK